MTSKTDISEADKLHNAGRVTLPLTVRHNASQWGQKQEHSLTFDL